MQAIGSMHGCLRDDRESRLPAELARCLDQFAQPLALMMAVAEVCSEYARHVRVGRIKTPAYARLNDDVVSMWQDIRTEALLNLYRFGTPDFKALTDPARQLEILNCFLDERPHMEFPRPRGAQPADTLQALSHVYLYLDEAERSVCDRQTDYRIMNTRNLSIFSEFNLKAQQLREQHRALVDNPEQASFASDAPKTMFEILYEDVTTKAKNIALSANYGPRYESVMNNVVWFAETRMREKGEDEETITMELSKTRELIGSILSADDPDHLEATRAPRGSGALEA